jgi:hypothetical protein
MKIALMHFHLKTGGVGTVIRQQIACLKTWAEVLVISGEPPPQEFPAQTVHIPGIAYDHLLPMPTDPTDVAHAIYNAICSKWPEGCDLLHVHNPLLAKNRYYLKILKKLSTLGIKLFLQIHDFAEDGRPDVYFNEAYPDMCVYGVINSRDYHILQTAGAQKEGLVKLDNMVNPLPQKSTTTTPFGRYVLYPVRALRRKNIGEAILLSLFFVNDTQLAITLPPNSSKDMAVYKDWQRFVAKYKLNVVFEVGLNHHFPDLVQHADFIITTSICEGFGFCFVEPWIAGKLLWGRHLPGICDDFEAHGVTLDHLYHRLLIPIEWIGKEDLFKKWFQAITTQINRFNLSLPLDQVSQQILKITTGQTVDFGYLDEFFQKKVIQRILENTLEHKTLLELNPFLKNIPDSHSDKGRISTNQETVLTAYAKKAYNQRLRATYQRVIDDTTRHCIDKQLLLKSFLNPVNTSLLKWGPYAPFRDYQ